MLIGSVGAEYGTGRSLERPARSLRSTCSGGEGIRTPVRSKIYHSVYARSPPIEVSGRWPVGGPLPDESARVSPTAGRRTGGLAQICDTHATPRAGFLVSTATLTPKG